MLIDPNLTITKSLNTARIVATGRAVLCCKPHQVGAAASLGKRASGANSWYPGALLLAGAHLFKSSLGGVPCGQVCGCTACIPKQRPQAFALFLGV